MEPKQALLASRLSLGLLAFGTSACTGVLSGSEDEAGSGAKTPEQVAADEAEAVIAEEIAEENDLLQNLNPELFDLAKSYFPSDDAGSPAARLYRLTRRQLDRTAESVLPGQVPESALESLPPDPLIRNYELANDLGFSPANFTPYVNWSEAAVEAVRQSPSSVVDCAGASDQAACYDAEARTFVANAFRDVASEEVVERYVSFFTSSVAEVGEAEAAADLVAVTLTSPHFSFREEVFTDASGTLLPASALQNLTYTLADVPPRALGLDSADPEQYLKTPEAWEQTISTILASPEAREKLLRFFIAWLEVKDPDQFNIDAGHFPEFTPEVAAAMVAETESFLKEQLSSAAPSLKSITESTQSFVSAALADIYGVPGGTGDVLVDLNPSERRGIFTHPSVIASHSGPTETRLVKRGAYFVRKVMCQELGEPPPDAIPTGPIPGNTERERIEGVTEPAVCAGCHSFINPFGFMLENYDPLGRFRTEDEGGFPINSLVEADFLDEGPLVADTAVDALAGFTDSAMFRQCFVRQLFTFYSGRQKTSSDDPTLRKMFFYFSEEDNQQLVNVLSILANSTNFNRRQEAQ